MSPSGRSGGKQWLIQYAKLCQSGAPMLGIILANVDANAPPDRPDASWPAQRTAMMMFLDFLDGTR
jgi:hypothetical protein